MVKLISDESLALFPISTIKGLITFVENEFLNVTDRDNGDTKAEPNLALLSLILGRIEQSLTTTVVPANGSSLKKARSNKLAKTLVEANTVSEMISDPIKEETTPKNGGDMHDFPPLEYDVVQGVYDTFKAILFTGLSTETVLRDKNSPEGTSRELIKGISDLFWNTLARNYLSDRPHLQTLYTFVTGVRRLDSFGLALAVVAGSQLLGLKDVHLVMSEDHVWVTFGKGDQANSTAEVTWHGKTVEDKRGLSVEDSFSWLYLKGTGIKCDRWTEMAAIITSINPSINILSDSREMSVIQQQLLWKLHDRKILGRYPMALGHLADLEEITLPTVEPAKVCVDLFEEAISVNRNHYQNMHVYPYLYYGGYLYRHEDFKGALRCWSEAALVISNYRYSKLDEEIYKEFLEISKELLTSIMKKCSAGFSAKSPTRDPLCYAYLLRFFDGICLWEELGKTPVLHITWAQAWINSLTKFEQTAREGVKLFEEGPKPCDEKTIICDTETPPPNGQSTSGFTDMNGNSKVPERDIEDAEDGNQFVSVYFRSFKMKSVKTLLEKEKFNPGTLTLQLTAQPTLLANTANANETGPHKFGGRSRGIKNKIHEEATPPPRKKRKQN